jgi:hypothetical protein
VKALLSVVVLACVVQGVVLTLGRDALSCDFCMMGQGISPYLTSTGRGLTLDVNYIESDNVYDKSQEISSGLQKEGWLIYSLTGFYAVTDRLSLMLTLPYAVKSNFDYTPAVGGTPASTPGVLTNGFGDITLSGRYTLFMRHTLESTFSLGFQGGVKFPTGSTDIRDVNGNPVDRHALPGTGSFDFPVGFTSAYSFGGRYLVTADAVYTLTTNGSWAGNTHRYGNSFNYNMKGFYKFAPSEPSEKSLFGFVGVSGETLGMERGILEDDGSYSFIENLSSGGTILFWDVGLYANLSATTTLNLGFSKAFYHYMNYDPNYDTDPGENYRIDAAITYLF